MKGLVWLADSRANVKSFPARVRAFQKKSKSGIGTPQAELDLVRRRLGDLRREVKNAEE